MTRPVLYGALLLVLGMTAGVLLASRREPEAPAAATESRLRGASARDTSRSSFAAPRREGPAGAPDVPAVVDQRLDRLTAALAAEANERRHLEQRMESMAQDIAALRGHTQTAATEDSAPRDGSATSGTSPSGASAAGGATETPGSADSANSMERALIAAGVDPAAAAEIKKRRDDLTLNELYLRDQAEREHWLNTPRFRDAMSQIEQQRISMRDEIGDDAYDRYLSATGEPNRVAVTDVLTDSAAAQAGLQAGDLILRYGDVRVFTPTDLVSETRSGNSGETVRVEILRNGQPIEISVPRGPLGLHITGSRDNPG